GIAEQPVEPAEALPDLAAEPADVVRPRHVGGEEPGAAAGRLDRLVEARHGLEAPRHADHRRAPRRAGQRGRPADAAGGAGDEDGVVMERGRHRLQAGRVPWATAVPVSASKTWRSAWPIW